MPAGLSRHAASRATEIASYRRSAAELAEGRRVRILMPPEAGTDFNDMLLGRA
jgi:hypothetical protein